MDIYRKKKLFTIIGVIGLILMVIGSILIIFDANISLLYFIGIDFLIVGVILFLIAIAYATRKICIC